jgi:outer membrane lipoprotein-sorting protein
MSRIKGGFMFPSKIYKFIATFIMIIACNTVLFAQEQMTAQNIIQTMTETLNPDQSEGKMKMTITTTSGDERTFLYHTWSKGGGEKSLMKYLEPSRVKGQTILMLNDGDDIWTYFPKKNHVRKLATHAKKQKLEGSDFSYEDMGGSNTFIEEYESIRLDDEKKQGYDCYTLELTRKLDKDAGYSRLIVWVDKKTFVPIVIDYYHEDDPELREKQLICQNIQLIHGIYTPMTYTMHNKLDNTKTSMEITEIDYDVDLPDHLFTEEGMKQ